jgi:hypothetical protein
MTRKSISYEYILCLSCHNITREISNNPLWISGQPDPGAQPLGIAVIDISIVVFGVIFPRVAQKHRLQV